MYISPTGFYSNSLFSALRKSREFAGGRWVAVPLPCSDLSLLSPHGKFSSLQFLLCGETKTTNQSCFADYSMSCKAWDGYLPQIRKFYCIISISTIWLSTGHCSWHSSWYGEYTWQSAMNQLLHSGLIRANCEPWPSPLFSMPVTLTLSLRLPRETFPFASWQHQPKTFPCLYHHWSSTASRTTLSPRHRVPRKLLTAWKETKN